MGNTNSQEDSSGVAHTREGKQMGEKALENRAARLKEIEAEIAGLQDEANELKDELKEYMTSREIVEATAGQYTIHYQIITSHRFDSKTFRADHKTLYERYQTEIQSTRFTVA